MCVVYDDNNKIFLPKSQGVCRALAVVAYRIRCKLKDWRARNHREILPFRRVACAACTSAALLLLAANGARVVVLLRQPSLKRREFIELRVAL